ncbi:MAG: dihydropteroate synthase [Planctomycetota bacterium]|nr:MAG: dihydropteroate synthase [Planctomycetota bacterium]
MDSEHYLFVTGKLAEKTLRRVVEQAASENGFRYSVAVMPITVAALMTPRWIARHLEPAPEVTRIFIPGGCPGDEGILAKKLGRPVERGPADLREIPQFFRRRTKPIEYGEYDIAVVGMIDAAERLDVKTITDRAFAMFEAGADSIGLGHDSAEPWDNVSAAVRALRKAGQRVLVRSRDPEVLDRAVEAGAEWVAPVAPSQVERFGSGNVVPIVVPEIPGTLDGIDELLESAEDGGDPSPDAASWIFDPVLAPVGFGFSQSLLRYFHARAMWPRLPLAMDLTPVLRSSPTDTAGLIFLLLAFCQELQVQTVFVSQSTNRTRSAVRECDIARRLTWCAVRHGILPAGLESRLAIVRDSELHDNDVLIDDLRERLKDPSPRFFVSNGSLRALFADETFESPDPFDLFSQLLEAHRRVDRPVEPEIAFYWGYELAKAVTARDLGKNYYQDEALNWGLLTVRELTRLERRYLRRVRKIDSDCLDGTEEPSRDG